MRPEAKEEMAQEKAKDKEEKKAETQIRAEDKEEKKEETECPRARAVEPPLVTTKRFASPPSFPRHVAAPSGSHRRTFPLSWSGNVRSFRKNFPMQYICLYIYI